uniref:Cell adhesion associated, oncogene regulated n=1 Tax=Kryptolebias marmoratus TaxID=37003 RepID=A0A3Q3AIH6_KRYMA
MFPSSCLFALQVFRADEGERSGAAMDGGLSVLLSTVLCLSQSLLISCSFQHPSFVSEPTSVVQSPGSAARLRCSASPPSAAVSWRFRGVLLERGALPGVELGRDSLVISNLTAAHAGVYQCVARLGHGRLARVALAEISEYEEVRRRTVSVQEGGTVLIECPLPRSVPAARPRLRVRGDWIRESTDNYLVLPSGNLQIVSASARHQGMYKCGAINPVTGEAVVQSHGTKLSVKHPDPSSPVRILYPVAPMAVSAQLSQPLTLECVVSGSPAPAARWFRNGEEVKLGPSRQRRRNNLVFVRPMRSDEGSYSCAVETERGTAVSPNYTVSVLARPSGLLGSFRLRCDGKPRPQRHLAVQRRAGCPVAPPPGPRSPAGCLGRDGAGRGRLPVPAGQRARLGSGARDAADAAR